MKIRNIKLIFTLVLIFTLLVGTTGSVYAAKPNPTYEVHFISASTTQLTVAYSFNDITVASATIDFVKGDYQAASSYQNIFPSRTKSYESSNITVDIFSARVGPGTYIVELHLLNKKGKLIGSAQDTIIVP